MKQLSGVPEGKGREELVWVANRGDELPEVTWGHAPAVAERVVKPRTSRASEPAPAVAGSLPAHHSKAPVSTTLLSAALDSQENWAQTTNHKKNKFNNNIFATLFE